MMLIRACVIRLTLKFYVTFELSFIHSNDDIKYLSGDYIMYLFEWLEYNSASWDILIDTRHPE